MLRINYVLPRPDLSGGLKSSRLIAEAMGRRGHKVTILFPTKRRPLPSLRHPRQWIKEIWHRCAWAGCEHHLVKSTVGLLPVARHYVTSGDAPDADITMASWWETVESLNDWPASKGIKVHYIRGYEVFCRRHRARVESVYRLNYPKVVNGTWLKRVMEEEYGKEAVVVPNGVDRSQFAADVRSKASVPTVGLLYHESVNKGVVDAFEAIRIAQCRIPELRVISFGMSPSLKLIPPPNFTYYVRPAQNLIPKIYQSVDCWIISSLSEGLPMPGLEAAACRCPVVATRCGGAEDYVQDGINGYLVPVQDPAAMAVRLLDVLYASDGEWRNMSEASYRIAQGFDWDRSAERLEGVLHEVISRQSPLLV
jgi:glycosyltransferase involved in cell wall biosynthesis